MPRELNGNDKGTLPFATVIQEEHELLCKLEERVAAGGGGSEPEQEKCRRLIGELHKERRSALCLSGGGIRSATFSLGILQGLARKGVLSKFHYLSTVSGGGYIGSWLTAWFHRQGAEEVTRALRDEEYPARGWEPPTEPEAMYHLRSFSNYLTPRLGLMSADSWALIATYLRNLLLTWLVLLPIPAVLITVPQICVVAAEVPGQHAGFFYGLAGLGLLLLLWGAINIARYRPTVTYIKGQKNEGRMLEQGGYLRKCLTPVGIGAFLLAAALGRELTLPAKLYPRWCLPAGSVVIALIGWVVYLRCWLKCPTNQEAKKNKCRLAKCIGWQVVGVLGGGVLPSLFYTK